MITEVTQQVVKSGIHFLRNWTHFPGKGGITPQLSKQHTSDGWEYAALLGAWKVEDVGEGNCAPRPARSFHSKLSNRGASYRFTAMVQ
jgi:hypothetical protein